MPEVTQGPAGRPSALRRALTLLLKIVVSTGLLYLLLGRTDLSRSGATSGTRLRLAGRRALALSRDDPPERVALADPAGRPAHRRSRVRLLNSYLVATFFNNFLPSNIGGDVIRIRDTAPQAGSKTLATTVVLMDRGLGLLGLLTIAAAGSSIASRIGGRPPVLASLLWLALARESRRRPRRYSCRAAWPAC